MLMHSSKICEQSARECIKLAWATDDPDLREALLKMAHDWLEAAATEEAYQKEIMARVDKKAESIAA